MQLGDILPRHRPLITMSQGKIKVEREYRSWLHEMPEDVCNWGQVPCGCNFSRFSNKLPFTFSQTVILSHRLSMDTPAAMTCLLTYYVCFYVILTVPTIHCVWCKWIVLNRNVSWDRVEPNHLGNHPIGVIPDHLAVLSTCVLVRGRMSVSVSVCVCVCVCA